MIGAGKLKTAPGFATAGLESGALDVGNGNGDAVSQRHESAGIKSCASPARILRVKTWETGNGESVSQKAKKAFRGVGWWW